MSEIKPLKVGDDWLCWDECPQATDKSYSHCLCEIDGEYRRHANDAIGDHAVHLCPHHYRRMSVALDAFESGRLWVNGGILVLDDYEGGTLRLPTLDEAVDALLAEQEDASKLMAERGDADASYRGEEE